MLEFKCQSTDALCLFEKPGRLCCYCTVVDLFTCMQVFHKAAGCSFNSILFLPPGGVESLIVAVICAGQRVLSHSVQCL